MSWLTKAAHRRQAQIPSAQEVITGLIQGSWNLQNATEALRKMVSQDNSVCDQIAYQYRAVTQSGAKSEVARTIEALSRDVCGEQMQPQPKPMPAPQNQIPPVENADIPESEEFL